MLSLRYHITSLVAIFAALAVGIALGGGPLQRDGGKTTRDLVKAREQLAAARTTATAGQANSAFVDRYVLGTAGPLVGGSLAKRSVAVVELPGADSAAVAGVTDLVSQAGGTVTGTLKLANKVDQAGNRQLVDALTTQMVAQAKDISLPASQPTYARLGYLVGRALGSTTPTAAYDDTAVSLVAGLDTAGLASTSGQPTGRSGLVLVVGSATGVPAIERDIVAGLKASTAGVALATPTPPRGGSTLQTVRADSELGKTVTTVDPVDSSAGQVVTVLALAGLAAGHPGSYGATGATGTVPARQ
jgi:hypothetical protein